MRGNRSRWKAVLAWLLMGFFALVAIVACVLSAEAFRFTLLVLLLLYLAGRHE